MRYKVNDPENHAGQTELTRQASNASWQYNRNADTMKSRSKEAILILVAGLLTVAVIALVATLILQMAVFNKEEYKEMCQSEECVKTAARVIESMDRSFEPCDDFYRFACGGWTKNNPIPQSQTSWDQLSLLREELMRNLRVLLEEDNSPNDLRPVKLARALYRTCMDTESVEELGLEPIFDVLSRLGLPREPPLGNDIEPLNLANLSGVVQRVLGLNLFVNFYINEDVRDTTRNRMTMEQVSPGFSERYLLEPSRFQSELKEYRKYVTSMMELAGAGNKSAAFANELIGFSTEIAKIVTTPEQRRSVNHLFHDITVTELQRLTDLYAQQWNWTTYLGAVFNNTNVTINNDVDRIIVMDLEYLRKLPGLLANIPPATLARYAWWGVYSTVAPLTLQKFRDLGFEFSQKLFGLKEKTARWKGCTGNVNSNFGMALSYLYIQRHFNEHSREKALEMLSDIKDAFDEMVAELDWMDAGTRATAHKKLAAIRPFVGFPEWITNPDRLNEFYNGAEVVDKRLFETFLKLTNIGVRKSLNSLRKEPDKNRWISTGTTVNAFYSAILNSVTFPAGILHPPFYGNGIESINYGAMGAIMGHELTHGFDDQGRRYDENGNLRQWWSNETLIHYHEKVECIIKQYSNYHVPELGDHYTVNGLNTQGENIADNGGIREAYRAYKRLTVRNPSRQQALPGLTEYTQDQLFFLGFAQVWCGNYTTGALKSKLIEGVHAPNHFRVIGTLSNNAEFARAWHCPTESPMNPHHKCILW
ncbi:endothelin-converting enzyme 1 isoform X1 [Neodiprion pinetum]|uniref:endothelin-converting enzyme 1 isoform X1 n=2 Tax=Neodiprion pinetum TaxID=441929 RepID=UPI001EE00152|nr:endothelin-converting enzyme 1-like isoform X1 [Neodiprion pinetum]XP_046465760.1 endothelin-converting enzyme 1-like isoform X1 [Neodiprion pinetum]